MKINRYRLNEQSGSQHIWFKVMDACRYDGLLIGILAGESDANNDFNCLRNPVLQLGFEERTKGSHNLFWKSGIRKTRTIYGEVHLTKTY